MTKFNDDAPYIDNVAKYVTLIGIIGDVGLIISGLGFLANVLVVPPVIAGYAWIAYNLLWWITPLWLTTGFFYLTVYFLLPLAVILPFIGGFAAAAAKMKES